MGGRYVRGAVGNQQVCFYARAKAYRLAHDDLFPCKVTKVGRSYRVQTADLHRALSLEAV